MGLEMIFQGSDTVSPISSSCAMLAVDSSCKMDFLMFLWMDSTTSPDTCCNPDLLEVTEEVVLWHAALALGQQRHQAAS